MEPDSSFTSVMALTIECQKNIPEQYVLPPLQRPNMSLTDHIPTSLPVIDLSMINHPAHRSQVIDEVRAACKQLCFFQVSIYAKTSIKQENTYIDI